MSRLSILLIFLATTALAHDGVKDPDVKARMHLMKDIAAATKVLAEMQEGRVPFDSAKADAARQKLLAGALATAAAFETPADDPKSEARAAIWQDWQGFTAEAGAMAAAAEEGSVATAADLRATLVAVGRTCQSCHEVYRD